ncbi:MAG TPA: amidase [Burkholderiales bacterium]|nr:amidase [Burkholderiales bacterium]
MSRSKQKPVVAKPLELYALTAAQAVAAMRAGEFSSEELVAACLARIAQLEPGVQAWTFLDPDDAMQQARRADAERREGKVFGALHGVPVGVKDIIDTADMPTECGTPLHTGRRPERDAAVVTRLREAGAVLLGKTVTTEFAYYTPGKTVNPHDPARTPGGSSSGSAAAVAAEMVPLALGTQTNGSVLRPASFCGVVGYKPTHGLISRHGVLKQSRTLDHVGFFARSIEDAALLGDCLLGYDERDPDMRPRVRPQLVRTVNEEPPATPMFAFVKTPMWEQADRDTQQGFAELLKHLGTQANEIDLSEMINDAVAAHRVLMEADFASSFAHEYDTSRERLSSALREIIERGRRVSPEQYNEALERIPPLNDALEDIFTSYGTILTPAVPGEAPLGLGSTGNPIFCTPWTLCGTPTLSVPLLRGAHGLPIGVQLVGARGDDGRLLRNARWLVQSVVGSG